MNKHQGFKTMLLAGAVFISTMAMTGNVSVHCDSMDGPVIAEARTALAKRDVTPLLKWIPEKDEGTLRAVFAQTLAARDSGKSTAEAADRKLFEKLVQIHRESEGAAFDGIKPAGQIPPIVSAADRALVDKSVDHLARELAADIESAIRAKFQTALADRRNAELSVVEGRKYVGSYIQFMHYVEEVANLSSPADSHHGEQEKAAAHKH